MKAWWFGLQANERRTLIIGGVVLGVMLFYFAIWSPLQSSIADLDQQVTEQRSVKVWMQQAAAEVNQLRSRGGGANQSLRGGRSLLAIVDQTAKSSGLGNSLKRLEPDGADAVKVWLEQASFDEMMVWLMSLEQRYMVVVNTISIDRHQSQGRVDVRMTLQGGQS